MPTNDLPGAIRLDLSPTEARALAFNPDAFTIDAFELAHPENCGTAPVPDTKKSFSDRVLDGLAAASRVQHATATVEAADLLDGRKLAEHTKNADVALFGIDRTSMTREEIRTRAVEIFADVKALRDFTDRLAAILSVDFLCSGCAIDVHRILLRLHIEPEKSRNKTDAKDGNSAAVEDILRAFEKLMAASQTSKAPTP